jgi:DNA-directed RNA polymerase subunit K/omega
MDPEVVRSGDEGVPVVKKDTPAGRALREVADRLLSLIESDTQ